MPWDTERKRPNTQDQKRAVALTGEEKESIIIAAVKIRISPGDLTDRSERLRRTKQGQIALTERQMRIVEFVNQQGRITNKDARTLFKISSQSAHKEFVKLVQMGVIKAVGQGRSLSYQLKSG